MLQINNESCVRCGACAQVCPNNLIAWEKKGIATYDPANDAYCIHCGHCFAVCPSGSICLDGVQSAAMQVVQPAPLETLQRDMLFRNRRSVRVFKSNLVPHTLLQEALQDASYAPTATNQQNVEWTLVEDPAQVRAVIEQTVEYLRKGAVGRYAAFINRYLDMYAAGKDIVLRGAPQAIFGHAPAESDWAAQDVSIALSYLELSLHARGVGSCWTGFVKAAAIAGAVPALQIPAGRLVQGGLMLGYPALQYARVPVREALRLTII